MDYASAFFSLSNFAILFVLFAKCVFQFWFLLIFLSFSAQIMYFQKCRLHFLELLFSFFFSCIFLFSVKISHFLINSFIDRKPIAKKIFASCMNVGLGLRAIRKEKCKFFRIRPTARRTQKKYNAFMLFHTRNLNIYFRLL